jgi:GcrA cell cycle regulator
MPAPTTDFRWTQENEAELTRRWNEGESANQIAVALRGDTGLTRNAVIGKVSRLGLRRSAFAAQVAARVARAPRPPPAPKPVKPPIAAKVIAFPVKVAPPAPMTRDANGHVGLALLDSRQCHYPVNSPGAHEAHLMLFCAAATDELETYCPFHKPIVWRGFPQKRSRA